MPFKNFPSNQNNTNISTNLPMQYNHRFFNLRKHLYHWGSSFLPSPTSAHPKTQNRFSSFEFIFLEFSIKSKHHKHFHKSFQCNTIIGFLIWGTIYIIEDPPSFLLPPQLTPRPKTVFSSLEFIFLDRLFQIQIQISKFLLGTRMPIFGFDCCNEI